MLRSLSGLKNKLARSDSQNADNKDNQAAQEAGAQSARGPQSTPVNLANQNAAKPPKFSLSGLKGHIKNKLSSNQPVDAAAAEAKKAGAGKEEKKKADDDSSSTSEVVDLTQVIPNSLSGQGGDSKPFILKIQYLERENRSLSSQLKQQKSENININQIQVKLQELADGGLCDEQAMNKLMTDSDTLVNVTKKRIAQLEKENDNLNGQLLISSQITTGQGQGDKGVEEEYQEEIVALKENLDRKEYLLQYNEQKYFQYEKVLRALILDQRTPEGVKDQLRVKIESQELFVPKDERKISNLVNQNTDNQDQIGALKSENLKLQSQVEELRQKLIAGQSGDHMNMTLEQLSIFANKEAGDYRNVEFGEVEGAQISQNPNQFNPEFNADKKYQKKLQLTVENLNLKLSKLKEELKNLKDENVTLRASNDNHVYINEKLNKALQKQIEGKNKKKGLKADNSKTGGQLVDQQISVHNSQGVEGTKDSNEGGGFGGDISSIMIAPMEPEAIGGGQFTDMDESLNLPKF